MIQFTTRVVLLGLQFASVAVNAVGLPDTGQDTCYNDFAADSVAASNGTSIARDAGSHPRQDCRFGRDAAAAAGVLPKTGAGAKGFDYRKIANNGAALDAGAVLGTAATEWACTRDNITGLTWEVKTPVTTDLRYSGHTYAWYNDAGGINGGNPGGTGSNTCSGTLPGNLCNTKAFIAAVNSGAGLCGQTDWRMPMVRELGTLVYAGGFNPSIAPVYFPGTTAAYFWSSSTFAGDPSIAWSVHFGVGSTALYTKASFNNYVRLVRGG